jgi:hypothetical protein
MSPRLDLVAETPLLGVDDSVSKTGVFVSSANLENKDGNLRIVSEMLPDIKDVGDGRVKTPPLFALGCNIGNIILYPFFFNRSASSLR